MRKMICLITAAVIAAALSITASAKNVYSDALGGSAKSYSGSEISAAALTKSKTLNDTLIIKKDEALVIASSCKLTLKKGCRVSGTLFVCGGGTLSVSGGKLDIRGSVVNEGTISIGKDAALSVADNGELFSSYRGRFNSKTAKVNLDGGSRIACLGDNKVSGCDKASEAILCANPASAAVLEMDPEGGVESSSLISADNLSRLLNTVYYTDIENIPQDDRQLAVVSMENGSVITFSTVYERLSEIGKADIASLLRLTNQVGFTVYASPYPQVFHNNAVYVYNWVFSNQKIVDGKVIQDDKLIDVDEVKANGKYLGRPTVDYNFRSSPDKEMYMTGSDMVFDAYELDNGKVIALIATEPLYDYVDGPYSNLYCHYLLERDSGV